MSDNKSGFTFKHLTKDIVGSILFGIDKTAILDSWALDGLDSNYGYITALDSDDTSQRIIGLRLLKIQFHHEEEKALSDQKIVILKSKPPGDVTCQNLQLVIGESISAELNEANQKLFLKYGVNNTHMKELMMVRLQDPVIKQVMPDIYWSMVDEVQDIYIFAMEYLDPEKFALVDAVPKGIRWQHKDMMDAVRTLALFHSRYYDRTDEIPDDLKKHLFTLNKSKIMEYKDETKFALLETYNHPVCNIWRDDISKDIFPVLLKACDHMDKVGDIIEGAPLTLSHNDCSIRNICVRKTPSDRKTRICFYDWEFVAIAPPQLDLAVLSLFFSEKNTTIAEYHNAVQVYITSLKQHIAPELREDKRLDFEEFIRVFDMCLLFKLTEQKGAIAAIHISKLNFRYLMNGIIEGHRYISRIKCNYDFLC